MIPARPAAKVETPPRLLECLAEIRERVAAARRLLVLLDYDGTLATIAPKPELARLEPGMRGALLALSRRRDVRLAIISGRSLEDIRGRVGLPELIYAGCHGLQISGPRAGFVEPKALGRRPALKRLASQLAAALKHAGGVEVEDKGLAVAVHFRRAAAAAEREATIAIGSLMARAGEGFRLGGGKKIWEILPDVDWDKGRAARWILDHAGGEAALPVCIGDDLTDEDAFAALPEGITVRVGGRSPTLARYSLAGPAEVETFLGWLGQTQPCSE